MGERTKQRPVASRPRRAEPRARVRARALRALVRPARDDGERAHRRARARRQPLLRHRLHALAEALDVRRTSSSAAPRAPCRRSSAGPPRPGTSASPRWLLFAIVFVWTPPHFWALALLIKDNYANAKRADAAGRPRRPRDGAPDRPLLARARRGDAARRGPGARPASLYVAAALALGGVFVWLAERLRRDPTPRRAVLLFHYSLLYLALLFVALALDVSSDGSRARPEERPPRLAALRRLPRSSSQGRGASRFLYLHFD